MFVMLNRGALIGDRYHEAGEVVEVDEDRAKNLTREGAAVEVEPDAETAAIIARESAAPEKPKRGRKPKAPPAPDVPQPAPETPPAPQTEAPNLSDSEDDIDI